MNGPRRNTTGTPRAIDDVRARRGTQQSAGGIAAGRGLTIDSTGRFETRLPDGFYFDDRGVPQMELGDGLALVGGSRKRFVFRPSEDDARAVVVLAAVTTEDIAEADGTSLTDALVRERNARVASDEALDSRVTTLENSADIVGVATLSGGEATVLDDGFVGDETILLSYQEIGSAPGYLYAPSADYSAGVRWKIKSTSATDDGTVFYRVRRAT